MIGTRAAPGKSQFSSERVGNVQTIRLLKLFFAVVLGVMLAVTTTASLERGVFEAGAALWRDAWFRATLADAYCGFLTFFAWVAYRERTHGARLGWFVALMLLGNIAASVYVLRRLARLPPGAGAAELLRDGTRS